MLPIDPNHLYYDAGESIRTRCRSDAERLSERGATLRDTGYIDSPRSTLEDFYYSCNFSGEEVKKVRIRSMEYKPAPQNSLTPRQESFPVGCCDDLLDKVKSIFRKRSASDSLNTANT